MPKACPYVMVSFFLWGVGLEEFGAEGVVVAEVFEVGGGGVGFEGGGSITALPIIETQAGDVSAYIPTNVISSNPTLPQEKRHHNVGTCLRHVSVQSAMYPFY